MSKLLAIIATGISIASVSGSNVNIWRETGVPQADEQVAFVVGLKHYVDHKEFVARNTPGNPAYHNGKFMTHHESRTLLSKNMQPCRELLLEFGKENDIAFTSLTKYNEYYQGVSSVKNLENLFGAKFLTYESDTMRVSRLEHTGEDYFYRLPQDLQSCLGHVGRVWDFPPRKETVHLKGFQNGKESDLVSSNYSYTSCPSNQACPQTVRAMYGVPNLANTTPSPDIRQAVFEYAVSGEQNSNLTSPTYYSPGDLKKFEEIFSLPLRSFRDVNGGQGDCVNNFEECGEPDLDIQAMMTTNSMNTVQSQNIYYNYVDQSAVMLTLADLNVSSLAVLSISYGGPETNNRTDCDELKALADQGVSVFISSGDQGANSGTCTVSNFHDKETCSYQVSADANCPYVTSVGGTKGFEQDSEVAAIGNSTECLISSGGGFSEYFTTENSDLSWQRDATQNYVSKYMKTPVNGLTSVWTPAALNGRGVPDISAVACNFVVVIGGATSPICGTSVSAPLTAGMISMMAMMHNVQGWGWINPVLYQNPEIFWDVTEGANYCGNYWNNGTCIEVDGKVWGYFARPGWDPVTGLGTLGTQGSFDRLSQALMAART